jgi:hypothetical protein
MLKRILKRGETSGREDDNEESIRKRFRMSSSFILQLLVFTSLVCARNLQGYDYARDRILREARKGCRIGQYR